LPPRPAAGKQEIIVPPFDTSMGAVMPHTGAALWLGLRTLRNLRKAFAWAWLDIVCQYRRSKIGPLWETINALVMTVGMTAVSSAVIGGSPGNLIGYIGLGMIIWTMVSAFVSEGGSTLIANREYILSNNLSIDFFISRMVMRKLIIFSHHLALYFLGLLVGVLSLHWSSLLAIPGIFLLFVNGFWIVTTLALVCARFRDLELIIRNLMQLVFFVTPIFWDYRHIPSNRSFIVDYNLFFYFIEIVRGPLLGEVPPVQYYVVVLVVTVLGYLLAYLTYRWLRRNLAFFV
jgi:homopolymeric O-antigen transport system permease protein